MTSLTQTRRRTHAYRDVEARLARWLARNSIGLLRISLGLVFLGFGVLKFVPGLSPAEPLASRMLEILTLGLIPARVGLVVVAGLESLIGVLLLSGRGMRLALVLLAVELVGILSPVVLLPAQMFGTSQAGLLAPTLEGQYVLKDIILVAAAGVVAARTLGARMVVDR